ncbi:MAG: hypothetical protein JSR69_20035 [Proteobacteria bacterium]|nr:hypothetical protein [Pseudomonadota bacterium]
MWQEDWLGRDALLNFQKRTTSSAVLSGDVASTNASIPFATVTRAVIHRYGGAEEIELETVGSPAKAGLQASVGEVLPLARAADAQRLLESGRSSGAILLRP